MWVSAMFDVGALVQAWGYPVVVVGTALQGDAALLICGFLAHQGYLNVFLVWLVGALSAAAGDVIYFYLGWRWGDKVLNKLPGMAKSSLAWARDVVDRNPTRVMIFMRYFFGVRMAMPILCGMSSIPFGRFFRYILLTAFIWAGIFVWAGYLFGLAAKQIVGKVEEFEIIFVVALAVLSIVYGLISKRASKRFIPEDEGGNTSEEP
jgi:membrane protein DedA with SNARE-associated domain